MGMYETSKKSGCPVFFCIFLFPKRSGRLVFFPLERVDLWFHDEARFDQQNQTTRLWAKQEDYPAKHYSIATN
ncbi:hypothetical protein [Shewanella chilikensis]|uniref:hypothetical protein n=1 Tax=Shewanella chilikensis TaxID=558541 RepID=UPI001F34F69D|nr:hypothetical protein [Shewanella chilikensis]MCE9786449.1 hypothetical protein [Shewanella chilikensis]